MANYDTLTQLRPIAISGITGNHNIYEDTGPVLATIGTGTVLAANLNIHASTFGSEDLVEATMVDTTALFEGGPFTNETDIFTGDIRFRDCLVNIDGIIPSFNTGNTEFQLGGSTASNAVNFPTFELTESNMIWTPGGDLATIPQLTVDTRNITDHLIGGIGSIGRRNYVFDRSRIFADTRIGRGGTLDAIPRSPGLQLANANRISFTGATFDGWWMNLGLGLAVGNTTLRLATRNNSATSQRYKLRITDEPTLTGKYGLLAQADISNFIPDPDIEFSRGINIRQTPGSLGGNEYWIVNSLFPGSGIEINAFGITGGSVKVNSCFAWNPLFTDLDTDNIIDDIKLHFVSTDVPNVYELPTAYDINTLPINLPNNSNIPSNGLLMISDTATPISQLEADFVTLNFPGPGDFVTGMKTYTHNLPFSPLPSSQNSIVLDSSDFDVSFGADEIQPNLSVSDNIIGETDVVVAGVSQSAALTADRTTLDDVYRGIKAQWYDQEGTPDASGYNPFQSAFRDYTPLTDEIYTINGDLSFTSGVNNAVLATDNTSIGQATAASISVGTHINTLSLDLFPTPERLATVLPFDEHIAGTAAFPPEVDLRGYIKFYDDSLTNLISSNTLVTGGATEWATTNEGTIAISRYNKEGTDIGPLLQSFGILTTGTSVTKEIHLTTPDNFVIALTLQQTIDASSPAYNNPLIDFNDVRFYSVRVAVNPNVTIVEGRELSINFFTATTRIPGSRGNFTGIDLQPITHGLICNQIRWSAGQTPVPALNQVFAILVDTEQLVDGQFALEYPGDGNRYQIRNCDTTGMEINNIDSMSREILVEFIDTRGTPAVLNANVVEYQTPTFTVVEIPATEPTGTYYVAHSNINLDSFGTHTQGTASQILNIENVVGGSTNDYIVYFKPVNTNTIIYETNIISFNNDFDDFPLLNQDISLTAAEVPAVLAGAALSAITDATADFIRQVGNVALVDIHGAGEGLDASKSLKILLEAANNADYVIVCGFHRVDDDLISASIQSSTIFDNVLLTFESTAATIEEQRQQLLIGVIPNGNGITSNDLPFSSGVKAVLTQPNPAGTTPEEIRAEVDGSLDARRVTRENMRRLGILAPINDSDPT